MTYPFPMPVVPFRHAQPMTPEEEDAYYEIHAEPVPRWIRGPFALAGQVLSALRQRNAGMPRKAPRATPAHFCHRQ